MLSSRLECCGAVLIFAHSCCVGGSRFVQQTISGCMPLSSELLVAGSSPNERGSGPNTVSSSKIASKHRVNLARSNFFYADTVTNEIYTLSLHDALPIMPFSLDG